MADEQEATGKNAIQILAFASFAVNQAALSKKYQRYME